MNRRKMKRKISPAGLAVAAAVVLMIWHAFAMQPEITRNKETIEMLNSKIEYEKALAEETEKLKEKVNTDEYIEKVAREQLGLVKENEKIFIDMSSK